MPEWSNGLDSKSCVRATVPRVRIPLSPLFEAFSVLEIGFFVCFHYKDVYLCMIRKIKKLKMTTLIAQFDDATKLEKVIALFKSLKVPFQFDDGLKGMEIEPKNDENSEINALIQARLIEKYVVTGQWDKMDDEARQDASLLEKMLLTETESDFETVSADESDLFLTKLRQGVL